MAMKIAFGSQPKSMFLPPQHRKNCDDDQQNDSGGDDIANDRTELGARVGRVREEAILISHIGAPSNELEDQRA
jgi:hypothetical protein